MDQLETPSEQYVRDFNNGFLIAQNNPALAKKLQGIEYGSDRTGIKDGIDQFINEKTKEQRPSWLDNIAKSPIRPKGKDIDLDKG